MPLKRNVQYGLLGLLFALWLLACQSSPPSASKDGRPLPTLVPVEIDHATIQFYDIAGSTEQELRRQMTALGPNGYDAYTKWYIRWNWPGKGEKNCRLNETEASYEITVTFPRWIPTADATPELVTKWNRYLSALADHEKRHIENVVTRFPTVGAAIKGATCLTAEAAAQAALEPIRQFDSQYDLDTDHGRSQGARFP